MALAAGADLLCLGGEDAGERMLDDARDAIVAAVRSGDLEHRPAAATRRTGSARWPARSRGPASEPPRPTAGEPGRPLPRWRSPVRCPPPSPPILVLRCDEATNRRPSAPSPGVWPQPATAPLREIAVRHGDPLPADDIKLGRNGCWCSPGTGTGMPG